MEPKLECSICGGLLLDAVLMLAVFAGSIALVLSGVTRGSILPF